LLEIITIKSNEYQPEAISAAQAEIEKRNLSVEKTESAQKEVTKKEKLRIYNKNVPLGIGRKIITFFFPGIPNILIARTLKAEGFDRKWKEGWRWTIYGVLFYISLFIVGVMIIRQ
jgi:hypothetical protein